MSPVADGGGCFSIKRSKMLLMEGHFQCQTIGLSFPAAWIDFLLVLSDGNLAQISLDTCPEVALGGVQGDCRGDWVQRLMP